MKEEKIIRQPEQPEKVELPLDIPFKEFMPGQIIESEQFNDDMKDIEDKVNEVVSVHNSLVERVYEHQYDYFNPHAVTAHQTGTYEGEEIDAFVDDLKNGNLNDNSIENRVLADGCVDGRVIKDGCLTVSKTDAQFGNQLNISNNISITDRYTKTETDQIIQDKVGDGTYSKEQIDGMFEEYQAGTIIDGTIDASKLKDDVGQKIDISSNPSILDRYSKAEVNNLITKNGLPKDWGNLEEVDEDTPPSAIGNLPIANIMIADEFPISETPVLNIDVKEVIDARGDEANLKNRLDGIDGRLEGIVKKEVIISPSEVDKIQLELNKGNNVRLINGTYKLNNKIVLNNPSSQLKGNGIYNTIITYNSGFSDDCLIELNGSNSPGYRTNFLLSDFCIDGVNKIIDGVKCYDIADFNIERIKVSKCDKGLTTQGALLYKIIDSEISGNDIALYIVGVNDPEIGNPILSPNNSVLYQNVKIISNGVVLSHNGKHIGANMVFDTCEIEGNGEHGDKTRPCLSIKGNTQTGNNNIVTFRNCWIERNINDDVFSIDLVAPNNVVFDTCTMLNVANTNNRQINASGSGIIFINNTIDNSVYKIATCECSPTTRIMSNFYFAQKIIFTKDNGSVVFDGALQRTLTNLNLYGAKIRLSETGGSGYSEIWNSENNLRISSITGDLRFSIPTGQYWGNQECDWQRPFRIGLIYIWAYGDQIRVKVTNKPTNATDGTLLIGNLPT